MSEIEVVARGLLALEEDELTTKLGLLDRELNSGTKSATSIDDLMSMPTPRSGLGDLLKAGQNIFAPASAKAYKVFCSDIGELVKESDLATELTKLMDLKTAEASAQAVALLTPIFASSGLPQSLAVVVGTLLIKQIANKTSNLICTTWKKNIEENSGNTTENTAPGSESPAS